MTARFRPVYLVTAPITGGRGVLGFMVDDGAVGFVPSASTEGPTEGMRRLDELVSELLEAETAFEDPPIGAGPRSSLAMSPRCPCRQMMLAAG